MFIEKNIKSKLSKPGTISEKQQQQLYSTQYQDKNAYFLHVQAGVHAKTPTYCDHSFGFVLPRIVSVVYCIHRDKYASIPFSPPLIE